MCPHCCGTGQAPARWATLDDSVCRVCGCPATHRLTVVQWDGGRSELAVCRPCAELEMHRNDLRYELRAK